MRGVTHRGARSTSLTELSQIISGSELQSKGYEMPKPVNPTAYAFMHDYALHSKRSEGQSISKSQGFHLEAELMLVGGGMGDSDASLLVSRDLAQVAMDTQTVAAVECPEDSNLTQFLGLSWQRCVFLCLLLWPSTATFLGVVCFGGHISQLVMCCWCCCW
jgi:hypothetical protein